MSPYARRKGGCKDTGILSVVAAGLLAVFGSGCAPKPLYDWGRYEDSLNDSYVAHNEPQAFADLQATINSAQQSGGHIPPGVCAEYGFFLYKRGDREGAVGYFRQEAQLFPESKPLMDTLIAKVQQQAATETTPPTAEDSAP